MRDGPEAGLELIDSLLVMEELVNYHLAYAAKADLLRRAVRNTEAAGAYELALSLARQEPEIRFLQRRLRTLRGSR